VLFELDHGHVAGGGAVEAGALDVAGELGRRAHRVARHDPRAEPVRRQPQRDEHRRVGQRKVDRVAVVDAARREEAGGMGDDVVELAVGPLGDGPVRRLEHEEGRVCSRGDRAVPHLRERDRLGHDAAAP
jgi:hypothetical protein